MPSRIVTQQPKVSTFITRFDVQQRAQHILIISSFFILAVTGLPMKYSNWGISGWWIGVWHGIENVRAAHHYAAWVMIATCAYHLLYLLTSRPFSTAMLPKFKDIGDFIQDMKHTFHLSEKAPQFDRYSYRNKAAYWLVYPGSFVMVGTGLILLYPTGVTSRVPGWMLPLALVIHSDAAILAIGWIVCVHMYFAHFSKHTIPFDKSVITGKVPIERYREEFPLEYARIVAESDVRLPAHREAAPVWDEEPSELEESLVEDQSATD